MSLRYRLGAALLRPHVEELARHYARESQQNDQAKAERCSYILIGLRYALDWRTKT